MFGPNGCGKSTLINIIAGLIPPDAGEILFDGKPLRAIKFGYVFQNYREALFPWLRSVDNIEYPLKLMKMPKAERRARVEKLVAHLGVKIDLNRYPYEMSGGQQQLISIMRALVVEPEILFLDEPFSALDYEMTLFMREQLQRIFIETGTTTVLVSHDLEEAVYLADHVLLLSRGPARIADFVPLRRRKAADRRNAVGAQFVTHQSALPRGIPARGAQGMKQALDPFLPIVGVIGLIGAVVLAVWKRIVDPVLLPSPTDTFQAMYKGMAGGRLGFDFVKTVERTILATLIAAAIAIPLGILLGASERLYRSVEFVVDFFRSTPASAMFPLFLVLFGVGNETKISVAAFGAALVILFNVAYGVMNARKTRLLAAKVMGASRVQRADRRDAAGIAAADLRRLAQRRVARAGHRRRRRDVHRLDRRARPSGVRGAAAFQHAGHVCGDLRRRRARLRPQPAVPADRAQLRPLVRQVAAWRTRR